MRNQRARIASGIAIVTLLVAALAVSSAANPTETLTPGGCPASNPFVIEGSTCKYDADSDSYTLVSPGPELPPCERSAPPEGAIASSCRVVETIHEASGISALVTYDTQVGTRIRVWMLPSGVQIPLGVVKES
jgi:invasion protein IalB